MFLCHVLCLSRQQQTCAIEKKERPFQFPKRVFDSKKDAHDEILHGRGKRKREPHLLDYLGRYHRQGLRRGTCVSTIANLLLGDKHSLQSVEAAISIFDRYMATSTRVFSTDDDLVKVCLVCAMLATKVHERYFLNLGNFENITPKQARQLEVDILPFGMETAPRRPLAARHRRYLSVSQLGYIDPMVAARLEKRCALAVVPQQRAGRLHPRGGG